MALNSQLRISAILDLVKQHLQSDTLNSFTVWHAIMYLCLLACLSASIFLSISAYLSSSMSIFSVYHTAMAASIKGMGKNGYKFVLCSLLVAAVTIINTK